MPLLFISLFLYPFFCIIFFYNPFFILFFFVSLFFIFFFLYLFFYGTVCWRYTCIHRLCFWVHKNDFDFEYIEITHPLAYIRGQGGPTLSHRDEQSSWSRLKWVPVSHGYLTHRTPKATKSSPNIWLLGFHGTHRKPTLDPMNVKWGTKSKVDQLKQGSGKG